MTPDAIDRLCERIRTLGFDSLGVVDISSLERDVRLALEAAEERAEGLRKALINHDGHGGEKWCHVCGWSWLYGAPEIHAPGCIATPPLETTK
jgi:hypothetical protein